jgi:DNA-binding response OmpR family regulator
VDFTKMEVVRGHLQIPLALKEFRTLEFMIKNARRAISRDELRNEVWGYESYPSSRTVPHRGQSRPQASTEIGEQSG